MKQCILLFLFTASVYSGNAQNADNATSIRVFIQNISSEEGTIRVGLYNSKTTWLNKAVVGKVSKIENGNAVVEFSGIEKGNYAISLYHDENDNEELDTGWFGIPKEPYACSNGAKGKFGPPKWDDAVFLFDNKLVEHIIKL